MTEQTQSLREFQLATMLPKGARDKLELCIQDGIYSLRTWMSMSRHPAIPKSETVRFAIPETWWQHLKMDHFPSWAKRQWPIKMRVVERVVEWNEGPVLICPHMSSSSTSADHARFLAGFYNEDDLVDSDSL